MIALVVGVLAGVLVGVLLFYCISKHRSKSSMPEPSSHQQQAAVVPLQRAGPEYEEVVELKENMAYGPVHNIELRHVKLICLCSTDCHYNGKLFQNQQHECSRVLMGSVKVL